MTGDADYMLRVVVKDLAAYQAFLTNTLTCIPRRGWHQVGLRAEVGDAALGPAALSIDPVYLRNVTLF